ncbi:N-acetyltransferase [Favolaschia claudopus]|uniref:N-acetyltransferase n=1 Tax=Favolaschia claudopus TaxID=2862362 RepID=A0AAW0AZJ1_9AGAR
MGCGNSHCPTTLAANSQPALCARCSIVVYCSEGCRIAAWPTHKQECLAVAEPPPPSLQLRLRLLHRPKVVSPFRRENEYSAQRILDYKIEFHGDGQASQTLPVGEVRIQVIDIPMTRRNGGFFNCLDEYSHELGKLALHFDSDGMLHPNSGVFQPDDFETQNHLVYLQTVIVHEAWRSKGVGSWLISQLFDLDDVPNDAEYIFTWPTVLNTLEPIGVNGMFGDPTPAENAAWLAKKNRIIGWYRKAGFRRLANSGFFCLAKQSTHPSRSLPIEHDAPFKELPPPMTEAEWGRRYMAYH